MKHGSNLPLQHFSMEKMSFYQLTVQQSLDSLNTTKDGLTTAEALQRQKIYGKNILKNIHKESLFLKFAKQFKDALIILLIVSMIISIYLQDYRGATILGIIIVINAVIGYIQEARAEKIMQSLKKLLHPSAKVIRDGKLIEELSENLVPGDIVYIQEGDALPADLRVINETNLQTNDFSLTGESSPVNKFTHEIAGDVELGERNNIVFMGTTIATGEAYGLVIDTGMNTQLGKIANLSQEAKLEPTPLQVELENIAKKLTIGTIILGVILLAIALLAHFSIKEAFVFAIGIAAAMVPQGLPAQVSIALSLASWRLAKKNALIKQLASVETLGCVNIICTDKTGTLTKNEMTVRNIYLFNKIYEITGSGYEPNGHIIQNSELKIQNGGNEVSSEFINIRKHFFMCGILNSTARVNSPDSEHPLWYCMGDPTEGALITMSNKALFDLVKLQSSYPKLREYGFDSSRKMMSTVRDVDGQKIVYVKGAARSILDNCSQIFDGKQIRKITKRDKDRILAAIDYFASQAMRNLTLAYRVLDPNVTSMTMQETESDLIFLGFASIIDPPREEVADAIQAAYLAKIKVIMITGDYGLTAEAIAKKIGLSPQDQPILIIKGEELRKKTDIQLLYDLRNPYVIFSRTSPEDKMRIVSLLKKEHNIVAVTGDGVNDAPALKEANIGVAMGKIGTDVAKDASEIVLLDDSFSTLVNAIREGRIIYQNLKKTVLGAITTNGGELFTILMSLCAKAIRNIPIAIIPIQILAIDLIGEMGPYMMITYDPAKPGLMEAKPRNVKNHLLNKKTIIDLIYSGALMGIIAFSAYLIYFIIHNISPFGLDTLDILYMTGNSVTYVTINICQYMILLSRRTGIDSIFSKYTLTNRKLRFSFVISITLILVLIYNPFVSEYFRFGPMSWIDWILPVLGGIIYLGIHELRKYIKRKRIEKQELAIQNKLTQQAI
ncbi:MAG: cation-transporting P-type ATPase [Candidatus Absconditicoccaceae bacterium]